MLSSPVYIESHLRPPVSHPHLATISSRSSQPPNFPTCQHENDVQTPSNSSHPRPLLSRQHLAPLSPLPATLTDHPASVANKRLTARLTPLDATLTKNTGVGVSIISSPATKFQSPLYFQPLTNCPFSIPFVLTFIHVMGGTRTPSLPFNLLPRTFNAPTIPCFVTSLHPYLAPLFARISGQRAKTEVESPPRGVNSPRTTHHSGWMAATMSRRILLTAFS